MSLAMYLFASMSYVASVLFPFLGYMLALTAKYGLSGVLDLRTQQKRFFWSTLGWCMLTLGLLLGPVAYGAVHFSNWDERGGWTGGLAFFHIMFAVVLLITCSNLKEKKQLENKNFQNGDTEYRYLRHT